MAMSGLLRPGHPAAQPPLRPTSPGSWLHRFETMEPAFAESDSIGTPIWSLPRKMPGPDPNVRLNGSAPAGNRHPFDLKLRLSCDQPDRAFKTLWAIQRFPTRRGLRRPPAPTGRRTGSLRFPERRREPQMYSGLSRFRRFPAHPHACGQLFRPGPYRGL